jgi:hypothetical protein
VQISAIRADFSLERHMRVRVVPIVFLAIGLFAVAERPALAQDASIESQLLETGTAIAAPLAAVAATADVPDQGVLPEFSSGKQPRWFLPIHLFSIAVQGLDAHSTLRMLDHRSIEASPLYKGMTGNKVTFLAVKAGVTAAVVYATGKLSKRHRAAAVVSAAAINSVYLTMAASNYRSARAADNTWK